MADPDKYVPPDGYDPESAPDESIESEGLGPLPWLIPIAKTASEAFYAENIFKVLKGAVIDWTLDQAADKAVEGVEKAIDYKPPDLPPPSPPVDMGGPAMGVPADQVEGAPPNGSNPWDPSGTTTGETNENDGAALVTNPGDAATDGAPVEAHDVDDTPNNAPFGPVDMGTAAMGVPFEEPTSPPDSPVVPDVPDEPPAIETAPWDPASDSNWFTGPAAMPPIPLAPNEE